MLVTSSVSFPNSIMSLLPILYTLHWLPVEKILNLKFYYCLILSLDVLLIFLNSKHLHDSFDLLLINILFKFDFLLHSTLYHTKLSLPGTSCY